LYIFAVLVLKAEWLWDVLCSKVVLNWPTCLVFTQINMFLKLLNLC